MDAYRTLASPASARLTQQRSRFLALVEPATRDEVTSRLEALRREHHEATHVCTAFRCRIGAEIEAIADDAGEPHGSAGAPILQALEGAELVDVLAVVVRHFGGVKLGLGGLSRAYADVTAAALARALTVERVIEVTFRISFPPEAHAAVMRLIHHHAARVLDIRYDTRGTVVAALPPSRADRFQSAVREETAARATVERLS